MAKKKKKAWKKPKTRPITQKEYLQTLIQFSERAITKQGTGIDDFFANQAKRLKKELAQLNKK
ncbi:MAG: hypothetical protein OIN85_00865 [Candidatus Methanoperedens sp.]|nr:hypothetical protein [Candidatus Methanoperedens sp.]